MPRLTNKNYLLDRELLYELWNEIQGVFSYLTYNEQMAIHAFYAPTKELDNDEAITHRQTITKQDPSLPNRAGKAFTHLYKEIIKYEKRLAAAPAKPPSDVKVKIGSRVPVAHVGEKITLRPLARPEPDLKVLTDLLLDVASSVPTEELDRLGLQYEEKGAA